MLLTAALLMLQTTSAPACAATDAALPANLSGWTAPATGFGVNQAVTLDAGDVAKLPDVPAGAKPGGAVMIGFRIATAGRYGVALDQRGWVDVVPGMSGSAALKPTVQGLARPARRSARSCIMTCSRASTASTSPAFRRLR